MAWAPSFNTFCDPVAGQTLRADTGSGSVAGTINPLAANAAIYGGNNNTVKLAHTNAGIFGNGITSQMPNTLHINGLYMKPGTFCCNVGPIAPGGSTCSGTVYADLTTCTLRIVL